MIITLELLEVHSVNELLIRALMLLPRPKVFLLGILGSSVESQIHADGEVTAAIDETL